MDSRKNDEREEQNLSILNGLAKKEVNAEYIAKDVLKNPSLLPDLLTGVSSENSRIKFKSAKTLRIISDENPKMLYSKMDFFTNLLDSKNKILRWIAIDVIGNLASVDSENKFYRIFEKYYSLLSDESMITIGHVIDNSGKIARAKQHLTQKITSKLLNLETILKPYLTKECRNILLGKAILALGEYFDQIQNKDEVISFVKTQLNNNRNATKKKAESFLRKIMKKSPGR